jgi:predicted RNase H-like HicB family nuclease
MALAYRYKLERQENGWWLVRFSGVPEALTEGETEAEARRNALDCVIAALEGYMKAGKALPRRGRALSSVENRDIRCCIVDDRRPNDMAGTPRKPTKSHLSRAGKDMHSKNPKVRKEAGEVLALAPRKGKGKGR